jgi:peptidylprolyl isomerase
MKKILTSAILLLLIATSAQAFTNENHQKGQAFLKQNATAEGVVTTGSGLQYKVLKKGSGTVHPKATDTVKVHYHGTLIDGTVFDSSVERGKPISFPLNRVIKGWTEGLQLMVVGEKTRLFIPSELGYGFRSVGPIPAGSTLIFDVELLGINE